jgi:uncharacterized membrane protein
MGVVERPDRRARGRGSLVSEGRFDRLRTPVLLGSLVAGLGIALYLSLTRLAGGLPACGPVAGCETVALSEYSEIGGIPVAFLGAAFSAVLLVATLGWFRWHETRLLWAAYGLDMLGVIFVAYLTYLELFVIHAVCVWCATYAAVVVVSWLLLANEVRLAGRRDGATR